MLTRQQWIEKSLREGLTVSIGVNVKKGERITIVDERGCKLMLANVRFDSSNCLVVSIKCDDVEQLLADIPSYTFEEHDRRCMFPWSTAISIEAKDYEGIVDVAYLHENSLRKSRCERRR